MKPKPSPVTEYIQRDRPMVAPDTASSELFIDPRRDYFRWGVKDGEKVRSTGVAYSWEELREVQKTEGSFTVYVDAEYDTVKVIRACEQYGWRPVYARGRNITKSLELHKVCEL